MRAVVVIPWVSHDHARIRNARRLVSAIVEDLRESVGNDFSIVIHVNGSNGERVLSRLRIAINPEVQIEFSSGTTEGKIQAVHVGAEFAIESRADVLIVVDNDIVIPEGGIRRLLASFRQSESGVASARKAPYYGCCPTEFQRVYGYAVTQSFRLGIFPKRPTGSIYAIRPHIALSALPIGHAESDVLSAIGARPSGLLVYSPHARDFESEVRRRSRQWAASIGNGYERFHSHRDFNLEAGSIGLPDEIDKTLFGASIQLWCDVHAEAERRVQADAKVILATN